MEPRAGAAAAPAHPVDAEIGDTAAFVGALVRGLLDEHRLDVGALGLEMDHVCFRCATNGEYVARRAAMQCHGRVLVESMIGGRPIACVELFDPVRCHGFVVRCVELASPKPGRSHTAGLEHAEFVVGKHPADFVAEHAGLPWDKRAIGKEVNPDASVRVGGCYSAKFHELPLYKVARLEVESGASVPVPDTYFDQEY